MDYLDTLRCFVTVADAGGFAVAARRLGCSATAVTRAIAALEARLGVLLFQRSTRMVRLTEAGERFLQDCRPILNDLHEAEQAASGAQAEAQGLLSITAPQMFGIQHVAPIVQGFLQAQPRVQVRTLFVNRLVHLLDEGMDVAIRIAPLPDSGLTAVQVGALRRLVVASPAYLAQHGKPLHPADLSSHRAIGFAFDARTHAIALEVSRWRHRPAAVHLDQQQQRGGHCRRRGRHRPDPLPRLPGRSQPARRAAAHRARRARTAPCARAHRVPRRAAGPGQGARVCGMGARAPGQGAGAERARCGTR